MPLSKLMPTPKLALMVVSGGVLLGALGGQFANPVMKVAEKPDWRSHYESRFSANPEQFVETGPEDLSTATWFGPVYAQPAVFAPQYAPMPEYSPAVASERYSNDDAPEPYVASEVDQASVEAASTASDLADASAANPERSEALRSGKAFDDASAISAQTAPPDAALDDRTS
jgi:hypothetical protein